ncbi:MAG: class I SAM-dependent methyltransferase [Thermodesulfobacteriota bacterium]
MGSNHINQMNQITRSARWVKSLKSYLTNLTTSPLALPISKYPKPDPTGFPRATDAHHQNLQLQAEQHPLVDDHTFSSIEEYVNHLIHLRAYEEAARLVAGKTVLDVGCNVGYGIQVLSSTASCVAGIDVSPQAIKAAQERLGSAADIRLYNGVQCSFANSSFDVVTSFQVIEHVSDYHAYFSEIIRLLRPGGMVLFTTPNACLRLDPGMKPWNEFHVREFTGSELQELLLKWFGTVEVRGLLGKEEVYQIERNRVERAKIAARSQPARPRPSFKGFVKRVFPWTVQIRNMLRTYVKGEEETSKLARSQIERFSTRDLFYKTDHLEDALDLMALCRKT